MKGMMMYNGYGGLEKTRRHFKQIYFSLSIQPTTVGFKNGSSF